MLCSIFFCYSEFGLIPRWQSIKFKLSDPTISKKFIANQLVGDIEVLLMSFVTGVFIIAWYCLVKSHTQSLKKLSGTWLDNKPEWLSKEQHLCHLSIICLGLILAINGALTNSLKLIIGDIRPDFINRCQPDYNLIKDDQPDTYYTIEICQQKNRRLLLDGLKSTPSGHSSFIMCGLGFIYFWQCRFISGNQLRHIWCLFLIAIVMISRITDHKHHWYDVVAGGLLGVGIIFSCWNRIFNKRAPISVLPAPVSI